MGTHTFFEQSCPIEVGSHGKRCASPFSRRRLIITGAAWPALAWMGAAFAQSKKPPVVIGWLNTGSRDSSGQRLTEFKEGLAALGWKVGLQVVIEERWAEGRYVRVQPLADELAAKKPAVIVAGPLQAVAAAAKAAPKTPIVQASGGDLVAAGLAASLARPSGMVTGLTNMTAEIAEKHVELLLEASPKLQRVGFLSDPGKLNLAPIMKAVRRSIAKRAVDARYAEASRPEDIEPAIARLAKEGVHALVVIGSAMFREERRRIVKLALAQRWPVVASQPGLADEGALLTYSAHGEADYRRAAYYVDRILKGAKPGDLPIEQPTKFELMINMKTARALKLEISRELAVRADRVIE